MNFDNQGLIVPDISFYQDDDGTPQKVDFKKMKSAGAVGVILRGGQNTWVDEDFTDYKRDAKGLLPRGYYWFYDSRIDPGRQALIWKSAIGDDLPELGLWFDFEEDYHGSYAGERYWKQFVLAMATFYPNVRVHGIYTAKWWWDRQQVVELWFWDAFPLWVAQYGVSAPDVVLPRPWVGDANEPKLWQFTAHGDGAKYGVESRNIDLNYFNGGIDQFNSYFGLQVESPPAEESETTMLYGQVLMGLNIRKTPSTQYAPIGLLRAGDLVEANNNTNGWWHLTKWTRGNQVMTLPIGDCWAYEGVSNGYIKPVQPLPTTEYILHVKDGITRKFVITNE